MVYYLGWCRIPWAGLRRMGQVRMLSTGSPPTRSVSMPPSASSPRPSESRLASTNLQVSSSASLSNTAIEPRDPQSAVDSLADLEPILRGAEKAAKKRNIMYQDHLKAVQCLDSAVGEAEFRAFTAMNTPLKMARVLKSPGGGSGRDQVGRLLWEIRLMLRVACTCRRCVDPYSGQRRPRAFPHNLPGHLHVQNVTANQDSLRIVWAPDESAAEDDDDASDRQHRVGCHDPHVSEYSAAQIWDLVVNDNAKAICQPPRLLWDRREYEKNKERFTFSYEAFMVDPITREQAIHSLGLAGLVFFTGVPTEPKHTILRLAEMIAPVQKTMWGDVFYVENKQRAENVAYTSERLDLHTDLSYNVPRPHVQFLHCRENEAIGGESMFSDGFRGYYNMALGPHEGFQEALRETHAPLWQYQPAGSSKHETQNPVFQADSAGRPISITWSPPFLGNLLPGLLNHASYSSRVAAPALCGFSANGPGSMQLWTEASRAWERDISHQDNVYELKMAPGVAAAFINDRVLHARRAFDPSTGSRSFAGCYIDFGSASDRFARVLDARGLLEPATPQRQREARAVEVDQVKAMRELRAGNQADASDGVKSDC